MESIYIHKDILHDYPRDVTFYFNDFMLFLIKYKYPFTINYLPHDLDPTIICSVEKSKTDFCDCQDDGEFAYINKGGNYGVTDKEIYKSSLLYISTRHWDKLFLLVLEYLKDHPEYFISNCEAFRLELNDLEKWRTNPDPNKMVWNWLTEKP
jgi:hypothetical protein